MLFTVVYRKPEKVRTSTGFEHVTIPQGDIIVREHVYSRGKFVEKANHLANWAQVTSNSKKSDVAKFATCLEPI